MLLASARTAVLRLQKMMAVLTFSLWSRPGSTSRFLRGSTGTSHCLIDVLAVAGRLTSIILGLLRNLSASFLMGGGMVAEKSRVCRVAGSLVQKIGRAHV